jgi:hypothetical protein
MRPLHTLPALVALALLAHPAGADVVLDWNEVALARVAAAGQMPPDGARTMAMVHVAMFDALDAIDRRYRPVAFHARAPASASGEAAAALAAFTVLAALFPDQRPALEEARSESLAAIPEGEPKAAGIAVGEAAAAACLEARAGDGAGLPERYRPRTLPGVYVPTALPVSSGWPAVAPFFLAAAGELRPPPPPALTSETWARDYEEIRELGGRASAARTAEQTETALFWRITGPAAWNPVVRALAVSRPARPIETARLFALASLAAADAFLAVFDAKYEYGFWRPITAIRNGDLDGHDGTAPDPGWLPLVDTPLHPEYPCAHCISAAAVGAVLEAEFGRGEVAAIVMTSPTAPGATHRWTRIADYVREVSEARIWGGVHYRTSTEVAEAMGRAIGERAAATLLTPLPAPGRSGR